MPTETREVLVENREESSMRWVPYRWWNPRHWRAEQRTRIQRGGMVKVQKLPASFISMGDLWRTWTYKSRPVLVSTVDGQVELCLSWEDAGRLRDRLDKILANDPFDPDRLKSAADRVEAELRERYPDAEIVRTSYADWQPDGVHNWGDHAPSEGDLS